MKDNLVWNLELIEQFEKSEIEKHQDKNYTPVLLQIKALVINILEKDTKKKKQIQQIIESINIQEIVWNIVTHRDQKEFQSTLVSQMLSENQKQAVKKILKFERKWRKNKYPNFIL